MGIQAISMYKLLWLPLMLLSGVALAQDAPIGDDRGVFSKWKIKPILGIQAWATYTMGHQDYDPDSGTYVDTDNRLNIMLRRLRFGSTAQLGDRLYIKFLGAADFVGSDQRAGTVGGVNNGGFPNAQIWDVFAQYRLTPDSEALYVIGGYLRPPIGRESMSGALGASSFEKMWTQWYVRQHLVGTGPGGAGGAYLGGLSDLGEKVHVDYRGGVYNAANNSITAGRRYSSLFVSRINFMFGDREKATWTYGLAGANSFGGRRVFSIALNAANEGPSGAAAGGISLLGVDALMNFGMFHLEGEYHRMNREDGTNSSYESYTYGARAGYSFPLANPGRPDDPSYLEPSVMIYGFEGLTDGRGYGVVESTNYFGGRERVIDVGLNYHLRPGKVRLSLHYVDFTGDIGTLPPDGRLTWSNMQGGIGGIRRGDYVGFEVILNY